MTPSVVVESRLESTKDSLDIHYEVVLGILEDLVSIHALSWVDLEQSLDDSLQTSVAHEA